MRVHRQFGCWIVCGLLLVAMMGCTSRRLTIRSNPSGALVEVDGQRKGLTPVSMDFVHHGTREITLSAPGYETMTVQQPTPAPWYQHFPADFFTDHFLPYRAINRYDFTYDLMPRTVDAEDPNLLRGRAGDFRSQSLSGG